MQKINVGVLGATGSVGQRFVQLLADHPWFELTALAASQRSVGRSYREACNWFLSKDMPANIADMIIQPIDTTLDCQLVFSALPGDMAGPVEEAFAAAGYGVLTNVKSHRYDDDVPLVTAEVNPEHLGMIPHQQKKRGWSKGFIVANANCCAMPLTLTLAPLHRAFRIEALIVQTMQALSGAGYQGVPSLAALDNVIPFISGEEEKMGPETKKMLGGCENYEFKPAEFALSAHCNRVSTLDGHMETVSVSFEDPAVSVESVLDLWQNWKPLPQQLGLPSAPESPLILRSEANRPQTRLDRDSGNGMSVTIGRLRPCEVLDVKYVHLSHNTMRGAAGASILNAELMNAQGLLDTL